MYDLHDDHGTSTTIHHDSLALDDNSWNIGLIVGPSGSGKSTVARHEFGDFDSIPKLTKRDTRAVVDQFPSTMSTDEITALLSSVGFSSPPAWLRPVTALSTGERFRAETAIAIAQTPPDKAIVIDEFTSVVDRTVARIGSNAIAKHVRRLNRQFVAVACHFDIIDWLQPDWLLDMTDGTFTWRSVQPRPQVNVSIEPTTRHAWQAFARHHYLNSDIASSCRCWLARVNEQPAGFIGELRQPHAKARNIRRVSRIVVAPDYQGIGLASALLNILGAAYAHEHEQLSITTTHPSLIHGLNRSPLWAMTTRPTRTMRHARDRSQATTRNVRRTAAFRYMGESDPAAHHDLLG
jgi:ABC-type dipeptide/oligopeptide/nickel transport system ATPase subunit